MKVLRMVAGLSCRLLIASVQLQQKIFLGDLSAMNEGMIENYAKQSQWDRYNPVNRINDKYAPNAQQSLRGILSLNWEIVKGLTYHTDLSLSQTWNQNKEWTGAIINNYLDDNTGEVLYAGNANLEKKE